MKANLESYQELGDDACQAIRELISPDTVAAVEEASRIDWLPIELDVEMTEAVSQVCGEQGVRDWSRKAMRKSLDGPLLGPFLRSSIRIFGLSPGRLISLVPKGIEQVYRNAGHWRRGERTARSLVLIWEDVPPCVAWSPPTLAGYAGAFEALPEVAGFGYEVEFSVEETPEGKWNATFICRWDRDDLRYAGKGAATD